MNGSGKWEDTLLLHLGHWSWRYVIHRYDETHLVIADQFFLRFLRTAGNTALHCKTSTPSQYREAIGEGIKKVLVFCQRDELNLVKQIQAEFPQVQVTSGTYGYALAGVDRYPRLKPYAAPTGKLFQPVNVIISTSCADAEFIAKSMAENGLPYFHEYFARPLATWVQRHKGFQVSRFYDSALRHFAKSGPLNLLLQTDVLNALFENTPFSVRHLVRFLEKAQAKVILVTEKDELSQASRGQLLNRSIERSVWTKSPKRKMSVHYRDGDLLGCMERRRQIATDSKMLLQLQESNVETTAVCLEDFCADQSQHIASLARFLGCEEEHDITPLDYKAGYDGALKIMPAATEFRRELIDRLGIHGALKI